MQKSFSYSLLPVSGSLGISGAKHLLNRCMIGPMPDEIKRFASFTINQALNELTINQPVPAEPLGYDATDTDVPVGTSWVIKPYNSNFNTQRERSLRSWWINNIVKQNPSLTEKMILFWHNHFAIETSVISHSLLMYKYCNILRSNALGNFRQLLYEITVNPAMLIYLNGESNKVGAPNENYARELFELFSIGKGPLVAEGNYTNYTETDIKEAAKLLTGWRVNRTSSNSYFDLTRHDTTTKQFTTAFGSQKIANQGDNEYKVLVDLILQQKETARFIVRKLYRWFVYYQIDNQVETEIIEPLATTLFNNNYQLVPVLTQLLGSEHFFSTGFIGAYIKNPVEFVVGLYRQGEVKEPISVIPNYTQWNNLFYACRETGMGPGEPPDVAGWPAWYKAPAFNELWVTASTVPRRTTYSNDITTKGMSNNGVKYQVDALALTRYVTDPSNPVILVKSLAEVFLPVEAGDIKLAKLKDVLLAGLPDSSWTFEWNKYQNNQADVTQKALIIRKLLELITAIVKLPEYYLS